MRHSSFAAAAFLGLALAVAPGPVTGQEKPDAGAAAAASRAAADVQDWFGELESLHGKLEDLQAEALRDAQLSAARTELGNRIRLAMERADPDLARGLARMEAMELEATAAQQKSDGAKLQQLGAEAREIERQFSASQERVLQQPEIAAQVSAFQERLERRMVELNPDTEKLIARFRELEARLDRAAQQAGR